MNNGLSYSRSTRSSDTMPPLTSDPQSFAGNCNFLLQELGSDAGVAFGEAVAPKAPTSERPDHGMLMARILHAGFKEGEINAKSLRLILRAREDPEIDGRRARFREVVDEYVEMLRRAEEPERRMIADEFEDKLKSDLELLNRELRRAGLTSVFSKQGSVGVVIGLVTRVLDLGVGLALGMGGLLLANQKKRRAALDRRWSSWLFSATTGRLTVW